MSSPIGFIWQFLKITDIFFLPKLLYLDEMCMIKPYKPSNCYSIGLLFFEVVSKEREKIEVWTLAWLSAVVMRCGLKRCSLLGGGGRIYTLRFAAIVRVRIRCNLTEILEKFLEKSWSFAEVLELSWRCLRKSWQKSDLGGQFLHFRRDGNLGFFSKLVSQWSGWLDQKWRCKSRTKV